jgi:siroheme decarboxylase
VDKLSFRLLNKCQRGFPLVERPYGELGARLGAGEAEVLAALRALRQRGALSRIGAIVAPRVLGASTLATVAVPPSRLLEVANMVSGYPQVNHNYEREHAFNLWFVAQAPDAAKLAQVLAEIELRSGLAVLSLPLETEYWIDLGFALDGNARFPRSPRVRAMPAETRPLDECERSILAALEPGLALEPQPYARLAAQAGCRQSEAIACISGWLEEGLVRRFGVIVRHHELGYGANAMAVWDVPDDRVDELGAAIAREPCVTLCYRRRRALPRWPFNLYCMVHAKDRREARAAIGKLRARGLLDPYPHEVLFSTQRFKQRGARYAPRAAQVQLG